MILSAGHQCDGLIGREGIGLAVICGERQDALTRREGLRNHNLRLVLPALAGVGIAIGFLCESTQAYIGCLCIRRKVELHAGIVYLTGGVQADDGIRRLVMVLAFIFQQDVHLKLCHEVR